MSYSAGNVRLTLDKPTETYNNMKRHIITTLAALSCLVPLSAQDIETWESGGYTLRVIPGSENSVEITKYNGTDSELRIPATFRRDGTTYEVTSIGRQAFYYNRNITEVILPDGVSHIGEMAFTGCHNLCTLILPESLTSVEPFSFTEVGTEVIVLPDGVRTLNFANFLSDYRLNTLVLGKGIRTLGDVTLAELPGLKELYVLSPEIPAIDEDTTPFCGACCPDATVYVPAELLAMYPKRPDDQRLSVCQMNEDFENGWAYFHDYRPVPDLFTVLYKDAYTVECGESLPILYETINYKGVTVYGTEWICDDEGVATVFDGYVSGVKAGTTKGRLKVKTNQGEFISKDLTITVIGTDLNDTPRKSPTAGGHSDMPLIREEEGLTEIYSLDGIYLGSDARELAPGIYVERKNGESRKITVQ